MSDKSNLCCLITCCCIILFSYITYITFSILYLVQDKSLDDNCDDSNLWVYNLVSLILPLISRFCSAKNSSDKDEKTSTCQLISSLICSSLIETSLGVWGGIELYNNCNDCTDLKNSNLWNLGLTNFIIQIFSSSIIIIFITFSLISNCCNSSKNINQTLQIHPNIQAPTRVVPLTQFSIEQ